MMARRMPRSTATALAFIHGARQTAEEKDGDDARPDGVGQSDEKQCRHEDGGTEERHRARPDAGDLRTGNRHAGQRAEAEDENDKPKLSFAQRKALGKFGNHRRPGAHHEAVHQEQQGDAEAVFRHIGGAGGGDGHRGAGHAGWSFGECGWDEARASRPAR